MIKLPSRIGELIRRIEAGETVTQEDVDRLARLQSLDLVQAGEEFAQQAVERDAAHSKILEQP